MEPTGIVPHTMNRIVAFIRPCIRGGVIACRSETWLMFQPTLQKPPMNPPSATAHQMSSLGAKAIGSADRLNPIAVITSIRPTPSHAVRRPVNSAAARNPSEPTENASPIASGPSPRSVVRYRIRIAPPTLPKKLEVPVVAAIERSQRWPVTYRSPAPISCRIDGLGPWTASSCGSTGGSARRIHTRNAADHR